MYTLIQLTESDKRFIFALLAVIIIILVIFSFIGSLIVRAMKREGEDIDTMTYDVVKTHVITTEKAYKKYAHRKNRIAFYKESRIPILIMIVASLALVIYLAITNNWDYSLFDHNKTGIGTLFFIWDFSDCTTKFFGMTIINKWPVNFINKPHFEYEAIPSYIFIPMFTIGLLWYLHTIQRLIARILQIRKRGHDVFKKSLDGVNQPSEVMDQLAQAAGAVSSKTNPGQ